MPVPFRVDLSSIQALTAMVRELRKGGSHYGLVLANGGVLTYQHVLCLSSRPRSDGSAYPNENPLPEMVTDIPIPSFDKQAAGEAIIEVSSSACS